MKRDVVLVFSGGAMSGLFGAGVATALQKLGIYDRIHSIYSSSAGAHNAAYFLAKDTRLGSSIYYEDLIDEKFIKKKNKLKFFYKLIVNIFSKSKKESLVDIDYLMDVEKKRKKLDTEAISNSPISFFVKCLNVGSGKEEYLDGKKKTMDKLKATSAISPFYPKSVKIDNKDYVDGDLVSGTFDEQIENMILKNKDKKMVFILNKPLKRKVPKSHILKDFIWSLILFFYFKKDFLSKKIKATHREKKTSEKVHENVFIIEPDFKFPIFCTDKSRLIKLYKHGIDKANDKIKGII